MFDLPFMYLSDHFKSVLQNINTNWNNKLYIDMEGGIVHLFQNAAFFPLKYRNALLKKEKERTLFIIHQSQ